MDKSIIKLGLTLMIITMIATIALSITNEATKDKIKKQSELQLEKSLVELFPLADYFEETEDYFDTYQNSKFIGRILKAEAQGYSSTINLLVGINLENRITGISVLSQLETPGLGANIEKIEFLNQFIGKSSNEVLLTKDNGNIDGITGATISSRAVTEAVKAMVEKCPCDSVTSASPEWNYTQPAQPEEDKIEAAIITSRQRNAARNRRTDIASAIQRGAAGSYEGRG